jgi:hypothetical protein
MIQTVEPICLIDLKKYLPREKTTDLAIVRDKKKQKK